MGGIPQMSDNLAKFYDILMNGIYGRILLPIWDHYESVDDEGRKHGSIYYSHYFESPRGNLKVVYNDAKGDACLKNSDEVEHTRVITITILEKSQQIKVEFRIATEEEKKKGSYEIVLMENGITGLGDMTFGELADLCHNATYVGSFPGDVNPEFLLQK